MHPQHTRKLAVSFPKVPKPKSGPTCACFAGRDGPGGWPAVHMGGSSRPRWTGGSPRSRRCVSASAARQPGLARSAAEETRIGSRRDPPASGQGQRDMLYSRRPGALPWGSDEEVDDFRGLGAQRKDDDGTSDGDSSWNGGKKGGSLRSSSESSSEISSSVDSECNSMISFSLCSLSSSGSSSSTFSSETEGSSSGGEADTVLQKHHGSPPSTASRPPGVGMHDVRQEEYAPFVSTLSARRRRPPVASSMFFEASKYPARAPLPGRPPGRPAGPARRQAPQMVPRGRKLLPTRHGGRRPRPSPAARSAPATQRRRRCTARQPPAWDDSISNLKVYRADESTLIRRRMHARSRHAAVAASEYQEKLAEMRHNLSPFVDEYKRSTREQAAADYSPKIDMLDGRCSVCTPRPANQRRTPSLPPRRNGRTSMTNLLLTPAKRRTTPKHPQALDLDINFPAIQRTC
eukprot:GHVT01029784.1.p1 GENE.GHVT01029784.1~~GHVT01029784.1.p1  ORF type:complete len:461 (+),score=71.96 GHVT01029784.1:2027-3409(+)